jgi:ABC-2 type transport system permease protein
MAVLLGKVIASTLIVLTMMAGVAVSFVVSIFLNNMMFPSDNGNFNMPYVITVLSNNGVLEGLNALNVILIILIIVAGVMFYGFVGGIAGATVSRIEEMAEGMKLFTFTMMIGAYLPMFYAITNYVGSSDWGAFTYLVYLLPVSSIFIIPQYLLLGKVSSMLAIGAFGVQIVFIVLLTALANKVYESMLYSNGAVLKIKDIIGMAKTGKEKKNAGQ